MLLGLNPTDAVYLMTSGMRLKHAMKLVLILRLNQCFCLLNKLLFGLSVANQLHQGPPQSPDKTNSTFVIGLYTYPYAKKRLKARQ